MIRLQFLPALMPAYRNKQPTGFLHSALQINTLASWATLQEPRLSGVLKSLRLTNDIQRRPVTHLSRAVRDTQSETSVAKKGHWIYMTWLSDLLYQHHGLCHPVVKLTLGWAGVIYLSTPNKQRLDFSCCAGSRNPQKYSGQALSD